MDWLFSVDLVKSWAPMERPFWVDLESCLVPMVNLFWDHHSHLDVCSVLMANHLDLHYWVSRKYRSIYVAWIYSKILITNIAQT